MALSQTLDKTISANGTLQEEDLAPTPVRHHQSRQPLGINSAIDNSTKVAVNRGGHRVHNHSSDKAQNQPSNKQIPNQVEVLFQEHHLTRHPNSSTKQVPTTGAPSVHNAPQRYHSGHGRVTSPSQMSTNNLSVE